MMSPVSPLSDTLRASHASTKQKAYASLGIDFPNDKQMIQELRSDQPKSPFSSGGFYYFSGKYAEPTLVEFGQRSAKYFPSSLGTLLFYVGVALLVHVVFKLVSQNAKLTSA